MNIENELECLYDAVIIKQIEVKEEKFGNIIVPDLGKEKNLHGEVISVGPGKYTISGALLPSMLKVGDKVIIPSVGFTTFDHRGETFLIGPENNVLAKFK